MSKVYASILLVLAAGLHLTSASHVRADETLKLKGNVVFANIVASLTELEPAPYLGVSRGNLGFSVQSGSILPDSSPELSFVDETPVLTFTGKQGPNPAFFGLPIHVIATPHGLIFCTWTADFTIQPVSDTTGIFTGDGDFKIIGGIGRYWGARGSFNTFFQTGEIPLNADVAAAKFKQVGTISY